MTSISIPFLDLKNARPANAAPPIAPVRPSRILNQPGREFLLPIELSIPPSTRPDSQAHPLQSRKSLDISHVRSANTDRTINLGKVDPKETNPQAEKLVDAILERFPLAAPTTLLFVGTEGNRHTTMTCSLVASALASRKIGNILLVDGSSKNELTHTHSLNDQRGLSNLLAHCDDWYSTVHKLSISGLDFMPAGTTHWQNWGGEANLRKMSAEFKRKYQFICVSAGDALHSNSKLWAGVTDGTYLLVSLKNSNQDIAQSSVSELQSSGARLLGCIVTDTELAL